MFKLCIFPTKALKQYCEDIQTRAQAPSPDEALLAMEVITDRSELQKGTHDGDDSDERTSNKAMIG